MGQNLKSRYPHIFIDWHYFLNGKVNPNTLKIASRKKYYWKCHNKKCGCVWKATVYARINMGDVCPRCKERKKKKFTQDLIETKKIVEQIKKNQFDVETKFDSFFGEDTSNTRRKKVSAFIRKKINENKKLSITLRKMILNYKKKIIDFKTQKNGK